jgi:hypothetical protein
MQLAAPRYRGLDYVPPESVRKRRKRSLNHLGCDSGIHLEGRAPLFAECRHQWAGDLLADDPKVSPTVSGTPASALVRSRRASLLFNLWALAPIPKAKRALHENSVFIERARASTITH